MTCRASFASDRSVSLIVLLPGKFCDGLGLAVDMQLFRPDAAGYAGAHGAKTDLLLIRRRFVCRAGLATSLTATFNSRAVNVASPDILPPVE